MSGPRIPPLARFSAYGFLKNQRYFEPFLVVALVAKGLDFFDVGLLFAFKELVVNLVEIPSGAIADSWGRRRAMMISFVAYVMSFIAFGLADALGPLYAAMGGYAIGDAFRTGTHKAMIFAWLRSEGRAEERTQVYGYTRSWSKLGSAVSGLIAAGFVLWQGDFDVIFFAAAVPCVLNLVNFLGYPPQVEDESREEVPRTNPFRRAWATTRTAFSARGLRSIVAESMGFEGVFHAVKDYLQPVLLAAAMLWLTGLGELSEVQRSALLIGPVYFVLYLISSLASRRAHRFAAWAGGEAGAARRLWALAALAFATLTAGAVGDLRALTVVGFVGIHVLQNVWRPILVSRIDAVSDAHDGATVLSVESQSRRVATMVLAPAVGAAIDLTGSMWPVGVLGLGVCAMFLAAGRADSPGSGAAAVDGRAVEWEHSSK